MYIYNVNIRKAGINMKKRLFSFLLIIFAIIFLTGCNSNNKIDLAKKAKLLDWKSVHDEISSNGAKSTDYNDQWFIFSGIVSDIEENSCKMFIERDEKGYPLNAISVELKTEELKELKDGQTLSVVGKFKYSNSFTDLKEAFIFPKELYDDEHFQIDLLSSQDRKYTPHYFSEYEYDSNKNKISYTEISYGYTIKGNYQVNQQDIDRYTLKYNDKNQLVSEIRKSFVNKGSGEITAGSKETKYTYNEDGFISTMTVPSIYKGEDFTVYEYTYEKDKDGKIIKGTKKDTRWGDTTYEYDKDGKLTKEIGPTYTYTYKYDGDRLINKKATSNSSGTESENITYYYGVVGIN